MAEDTTLDAALAETSEADKRIKQLSGKVKEEAEAKATALQEKEVAEKRATDAEKLSQFSEGFADIVAENPSAKEFKDQLKEKFMGGMSIEDAKYLVLGKAGKLQPQVETYSPIGGSAVTNVTQPSEAKSIGQMTQAERREALLAAEGRGDLFIS